MHLRRLSPSLLLFVILVLLFMFMATPSTSQAAPAAPYLFTLDQGNGTTFTARQWGDESSHGWETVEGYSIVFDRGLWKWTYAIHDDDGRLVSSYLPVGETFVPFGLALGARPAYPALHLRPSMKISRELATLWPPPIGPTKKTANLLVILINFKDTKTTYSRDSFSTLLFGTGNHSLKDYYEEVSYGQFSVSAGPGGIPGWYQASSYAYIYQLRTGSPAKGGEYFLVENRQKAGFDEGLPGAGLLIWHIDEGKTDNDMECYPGGPACSSQHYRVSLVQADNRYDLEKNANRGDGGDPYPGTANNTSFNSGSSPNSSLFTEKAGNVSVTSISSSGYMMTATLSASFNASGRALSRVSPIISPLALSGVKMEFYRISGNGMLPRPVLTDRNGNWSQSGFTPGETYMVVPKKQGYTFLPGYIQFTEGNAQGLSFTSNRSFIIH